MTALIVLGIAQVPVLYWAFGAPSFKSVIGVVTATYVGVLIGKALERWG